MAKRGVSVGIEITGTAKGYKAAADDAAKATAELRRKANLNARETEQSFKMATIAVAKIGTAALAAKVAFEVYERVMNSTEGTSDKLEEQISLLDGSMQGLMRTIATGSWESLISNMKRTAEATRDMTIARDEYENVVAGNTITRGKLSLGLQEARTSAAEATDPAEKKKFIAEAIGYTKELTALNVNEIAQRLKIDEEYYQKLTGHSKDYFEYFLKQVPKLAQQYNKYFGKESIELEGISARLSDIDYLSQLGSLTDAQEKERHQLQLTKFVLEDYLLIQDDFSKKGQWNEYIKGIGEMGMMSAEGEKALVRLTKQLTTSETAITKAGDNLSKLKNINTTGSEGFKIKNVEVAKIPKLGQKLIYTTPGIQQFGGMTTGQITAALEEEKFQKTLEGTQLLVGGVEDAFTDLFVSISEGSGTAFGDMAKAFARSLKLMAAQMAAKAAIFGLLSLLSGGAGTIGMFAKGLLKGKKFASFMGYAEGTNFAPGGLSLVGERGPELVNLPRGSQVIPNNKIGNQRIEIQVKGRFDGKDIYFSGNNYAMMLNANT